MTKLILHLVASIDGFISTERGDAAPGALWNNEMQQSYLDDFNGAEGVIFGRKTYDAYYGHWSRVGTGELPSASKIELAWTQRLVAIRKYVVSNTLQSPGDDTTVIGGNITTRIRKLKEHHGGDLLLICGPELFAQLSTEGLIDEYRLYVSPLALGRGNHLFRDIPDPVSVRPERPVPLSNGMTIHSYAPIQREDR